MAKPTTVLLIVLVACAALVQVAPVSQEGQDHVRAEEARNLQNTNDFEQIHKITQRLALPPMPGFALRPPLGFALRPPLGFALRPPPGFAEQNHKIIQRFARIPPPGFAEQQGGARRPPNG